MSTNQIYKDEYIRVFWSKKERCLILKINGFKNYDNKHNKDFQRHIAYGVKTKLGANIKTRKAIYQFVRNVCDKKVYNREKTAYVAIDNHKYIWVPVCHTESPNM